jgi:endonuclease III
MRITNKHLEPRGCDTIGATIEDEKVRRLHILVSLMLSSQTKDIMTVAAMDRLLQRNFTVQYALDVDTDEFARIIYPVGFWRVRSMSTVLFVFSSLSDTHVDIVVCSVKLNTSKTLVEYYAINTMTTYRTRSTVFVHCPVSVDQRQAKSRVTSLLIVGVGPKMAYLS